MARIRTIKPDAFRSDSLSSIPRAARWTFAGLWTYVDDAGRGRDDVRLIKADLYPLDDSVSLSILSDDLEQIAAIGSVCRYEGEGKKLFHIPAWEEHQKINRPTPSKLPPCPKHESSVSTPPSEPEDSVSTHGGLSEPSPPERKGKEGKGREQGKEGSGRKRHIPDDWAPGDNHATIAARLELDLAEEVQKFRDYDKSKGPIWKDHDAAFNNWLRNNAKWGNSSRNPNRTNGPDAGLFDRAMERAQQRLEIVQ